MNDTTVFSVIYGSQSFAGQDHTGGTSGSITVWQMVCDGTHNKQPPGRSMKSVHISTSPAALSGDPRYGKWVSENLIHEEGVIIQIAAVISLNASPYAQAAMFLRLRHDAPLLQLDAKLRPHRLAITDTIKAFVGRADVLSVEELLDHNIILRDNFISSYCSDEEIAEVFVLTQLAEGAGKPEKVVVQTPEGGASTIYVPAAPKRRIRVRRPT